MFDIVDEYCCNLEEMSGVWKTTGVNQRRHQIEAPTRHPPAARALKCVGVKYSTDCLNLELRELAHAKMLQRVHHVRLVKVEHPEYENNE